LVLQYAHTIEQKVIVRFAVAHASANTEKENTRARIVEEMVYASTGRLRLSAGIVEEVGFVSMGGTK
jgi:hypothetical protein